MNFKGQTAFVTGAARGIGKAIALRFAREGANVVICDIREELLENTVKEIAELGVKVKGIVLDVTDENGVKEAINESVSEFGKIQILVNNAAIMPICEFLESKPADWKKTFDVNVYGTMCPTYAILPHMIENGYGRIVNIGSVAGVYGISYFVDYSATKGAVISFTKALSKVVADKGITVNCISPGSIDPSGKHSMTEFSFVGRAGTPDELANAVVFVASDEASYITGQNILVDGGRKKM